MSAKQILNVLLGASCIFCLSACNGAGSGATRSGSNSADTDEHSNEDSLKAHIAATSRENDVFFDPSGQVSHISSTYAYYGAIITSGQPWGGVSFKTLTDKNITFLQFTAIAGRKNSKDVGALFYTNTLGFYAITTGADNVINHSNFYFIQDIVVDGKKIYGPVYIAQYKDGSRNAWAIGNKYATLGPDINSITMYTEDGKDPYCFYHNRSLSIETWNIALGGCHDVYSPSSGSFKTLHDNQQSIYYSGELDDGVVSIKYTGKHTLPPTQPYGGVLVSVLNDKKYGEYTNLIFKAGRSNENWIGQDFIRKTGHEFAYTSHSTSGSITDLTDHANFNFDTEVTVFNHKIKDPVVFSQYKSGSHNAWAAGNKSGKATKDGHGLTLYTEESENYKSEAFCIATYDDNGSKLGKQHEWMFSIGECVERAIAVKGLIRDNDFTVFVTSAKTVQTESDTYVPVKFVPNGEMDVTVGQPYESRIEVSPLKSISANPDNSINEQVFFESLTPSLTNSEVITVKAGRKGSKDVATTLEYKMNNIAAHFVGDVHDIMPGKLNFYIGGKLFVNGVATQHPFYIGQGHRIDPKKMAGGFGVAYLGVAITAAGVRLRLWGSSVVNDSAMSLLLSGTGLTSVATGVWVFSMGVSVIKAAISNNAWVASLDIKNGALQVGNKCYKVSIEDNTKIHLSEIVCQ